MKCLQCGTEYLDISNPCPACGFKASVENAAVLQSPVNIPQPQPYLPQQPMPYAPPVQLYPQTMPSALNIPSSQPYLPQQPVLYAPPAQPYSQTSPPVYGAPPYPQPVPYGQPYPMQPPYKCLCPDGAYQTARQNHDKGVRNSADDFRCLCFTGEFAWSWGKQPRFRSGRHDGHGHL